MVSFSLRCIFVLSYIAYANAQSTEIDAYASLDHQKSSAAIISSMFDVLQSMDTTSEKKNIAILMGNIIFSRKDIVTRYDQSLLDFDYLDSRILFDVRKLEKFKLARIPFLDLVEEIKMEFEMYMEIAESIRTPSSTELPTMIENLNSTNDEYLNKYVSNILLIEDYESSYDFVSERQLELQARFGMDRAPPEQFIVFQLYLTLVASHLKSLAIDVFLYHYNYLFLGGITLEQLQTQIASRLESTERILENDYTLVSPYISSAHQIIQNFVPLYLKRDETFIELERTFQLMVTTNHGYWDKDSCLSSCYSMDGDMHGKELCYDGHCSTCNGRIRNCKSGPTVAHCDSKDPNNPRRHEWIETFDKNPCPDSPKLKQRYGTVQYPNDNGICDAGKMNCGGNKYEIGEDYFRGILTFGTRCQFCVCTCEENKYYSNSSTFIISSKLVEADTAKNMVVTGVKFKRQDRIVYVQIKQGKLLPGGFIDQVTQTWRKIEPLDRTKVDRQIEKQSYSDIKNIYNDFIVISEDAKYVNLDDLKCLSKDHVVTGIGLEVMKLFDLPDAIALRIKCQQFNFIEGHFLKNTEIIRDSRHHTAKRVSGLMPPDRVGIQNYETSRLFINDEFVEISMSDKDNDAGQSVVPWFDAQEVSTTTSVPLSGVGIYHVSSKESAGFFAYRLHSLDYSKLM